MHTVELHDLTSNEMKCVGQHLPTGHPASITRVPSTLGGRRFTVRAEGLTTPQARDLLDALEGLQEAVARGQARP